MQYVLTEKNNISRPVDCLKGSFQKQDNYKYSFEVLCTDETGTANVHVFNTSYIPHGYYDSLQSVPLSKFLSVIKQSGNNIL